MIPGGPSAPKMGVRRLDPHGRKGAPGSVLTRGGLCRDYLVGAHVKGGSVGITASALDP